MGAPKQPSGEADPRPQDVIRDALDEYWKFERPGETLCAEAKAALDALVAALEEAEQQRDNAKRAVANAQEVLGHAQQMADVVARVEAERDAARDALRRACEVIPQLAEQQAMDDDWWEPELAKLRDALAVPAGEPLVDELPECPECGALASPNMAHAEHCSLGVSPEGEKS